MKRCFVPTSKVNDVRFPQDLCLSCGKQPDSSFELAALPVWKRSFFSSLMRFVRMILRVKPRTEQLESLKVRLCDSCQRRMRFLAIIESWCFALMGLLFIFGIATASENRILFKLFLLSGVAAWTLSQFPKAGFYIQRNISPDPSMMGFTFHFRKTIVAESFGSLNGEAGRRQNVENGAWAVAKPHLKQLGIWVLFVLILALLLGSLVYYGSRY